jgi:hypothetical protein
MGTIFFPANVWELSFFFLLHGEVVISLPLNTTFPGVGHFLTFISICISQITIDIENIYTTLTILIAMGRYYLHKQLYCIHH